MKHPDGIEVYIRPTSSENGDQKFPEIETHLNGPNDNGRYQQCYIPYHDCQYDVVIRFSDDFKIGSESAIHAETLWRTQNSKVKAKSFTLRRSRLRGQQRVRTVRSLSYPSSKYPTRLPKCVASDGDLWDEPSRLTKFDQTEYCKRVLELPAGSLLVTLQRGHGKWVDGVVGTKDGPGDPSTNRLRTPNAFKRLPGKFGLKYVFEFRPRSSALLEQIENTRHSVISTGTPRANDVSLLGRYELQPDPALAVHKRETERLEALLKKAWERKRDAPQLPLARIADKRKRMTPTVCQCTDEECKRRKIVASTETETGSEDATPHTSRPKPATTARAKKTASALAGNDTIEDADAESTAITCSKCAKVKKAPRGEKVAWRSAKNKWMYVHVSAPDEAAPAEDADNGELLVHEEDRSFALAVEALRGISGKQHHASGTSVVSANAGEREASVEHDDGVSLASKDNVEAQEGKVPSLKIKLRLSGMASTTVRNAARTQQTAIFYDPGYDQTMGEVFPDGTVDLSEAYKTRSDALGSLCKRPTHCFVSKTPIELQSDIPGKRSEHTGAETESDFSLTQLGRSGDKISLADGTHIDRTPQDKAIELQPSSLPRKRSVSPTSSQPLSKRARVVLDLTLEDDEPRMVKKEADEAGKKKTAITIDDTTDDEDKIREDLEDIEMAQEDLRIKQEMQQEQSRLKREKLLLQRRLRKVGRKQATAPAQVKTDRESRAGF